MNNFPWQTFTRTLKALESLISILTYLIGLKIIIALALGFIGVIYLIKIFM